MWHSGTVTLVVQDMMTEPFEAGWFYKLEGKSQAHLPRNLLSRFLPNIFPVPLTDLCHQEAMFTYFINCLLMLAVATITLRNTVR